jgi:hypothetical protein
VGLADFSLGDIGSLFTGIREAITGEKIEDPNKKAELLNNLQMLEHKLITGQLKVNEQEAKHSSIFVAGWRPFIGWIGGFALGYNYIVQPLIVTLLLANGVEIVAPTLDISNLMLLVTGLLGFGGFRTYEKIKMRS